MSHHRSLVMLSLLLIAASLSACGGPSDPSAQGVTLRGALEGSGASTASLAGSSAASEDIVVTVQENPSITTTVAADGSFTLRGLPEGSFTLVFTRGGSALGEITFDAVKPNQEITIRVALSADGTSIILLEEKRNGIGHGDLELEGLVEAVLRLDPEGESRFMIDGYLVVALPGQTAIREGNRRRTVSDVVVGRHVHVKGAWLDAENGVQPVLALEIKLQGGGDDGDDDAGKSCMISGGKVGKTIELEGTVASGSADDFELKVSGNRATGPVDVDGSSASFKCNGTQGLTEDQCKATVTSGAKVHVSGTLETCDLSNAEVSAGDITVQK